MWSLRFTIKSLLVGFALSLIAAAQETPWRYAVKPGDSRDQVIQTYGEPKSVAHTGNREILLYPEGRVVLQDGKLLELHFAHAEPRFVYAQERAVTPPAPAPIVAPAAPPAPAMPTMPDPSVTPAGPATPPGPPQPLPWVYDLSSPPMRIVIGGLVLLLGFLLWLRNRLALSPEDPPPPAPPPATPPASRETAPRETAPHEAAPLYSPAPAPTPLPFSVTKPPAELTQDLLQQLDWKRVDELVASSFRLDDCRAELVQDDDDAVDVYLYRGSGSQPSAFVHCNSWHDGPVGVKPVRVLFGVMAAGGVSEGWFFATGDFTPEALEYATGKNLHLLTGEQFAKRINALPSGPRAKLLAAAFQGDCRTPTCQRCGAKLVLQPEPQPYWRCFNYPRCRASFAVRPA
jgi:restriction system protein